MKHYFTGLVFCFYPVIFFAQAVQNQKVELTSMRWMTLGWELGMNRTYIKVGTKRDGSLFKSGKVYGYKLGAFASIPLGTKLNIVNGLMYERKGAYSEGQEVLYRLRYFTISAVPAFSYKDISIEAGPFFSYLMKATDDIPKNVIKVGALTSDNFNPFDGGIKLAVGFTVFKKISFCFNYDFSIFSAYDYPDSGVTGHNTGFSHYKNRALSISVRSIFKQIQLNKTFP
jgi:Outer membrane protein beta-barrel domain